MHTYIYTPKSKPLHTHTERERKQYGTRTEQLELTEPLPFPQTESNINATRGSFDKTVTSARWLCTSGMRWFLPFWYSREPMFWLPHGWFPYYAEWLISFPRAPLGSVSVASWQLACTGVIALVADTIGAVVRLAVDARQKAAAAQQQQQQQQRQKEEPVRASAARSEDEKESKKDT